MPTVSNEDILGLIERVLQRIDIIEEKLDRVLGIQETEPQADDYDFDYVYSGVNYDNDQELDQPEGNFSDPMEGNSFQCKTEPNDTVSQLYEQMKRDNLNSAPPRRKPKRKPETDFSPIKNDEENEAVEEMVEKNSDYLEKLRHDIMHEAREGQVSLNQLFTQEFLHEYSVRKNHWKNCKKKAVTDLLLYNAVYVYLKQQQGISAKQIEKDTMDELKRLRNRMYVKICRNNPMYKRGPNLMKPPRKYLAPHLRCQLNSGEGSS